MDLKIAAGYVRVSTSDQIEYSPDSQEKAIRAAAMRDGYIIPDEYMFREDEGISGRYASKRQAFTTLIATAKQTPPPFTAIYVWQFSRFARNQEESLVYKNLLKKNGVIVKSVSQPLEDSPFSGLIEAVISWMDEYYLINLSTEVRRGMKEKASRGEAMGNPPFGYCVKDKVFTPDKNADAVRFIFEKYAAGASMRDICYELESMGVRTRKGSVPRIRWVQYILSNPTYIGKVRWSEQGAACYNRLCENLDNVSIVDGKHQPIIDLATWDSVQERLKQRPEPKYVRTNGHMYMLKGLLRCSNCGSTLTWARSKYPALQCCSYHNGACKVSHSISLRKANEAVLSALEEVIGNQAFVFTPSKAVTAPKQDWDKLIASENQRLQRAKNAMIDGLLTQDEYREVKQQVESNIQRMNESKETADKPQEISLDYINNCKSIIEMLRSDMPEGAKNAALKAVIDKIVFNKSENKFDIYFLP